MNASNVNPSNQVLATLPNITTIAKPAPFNLVKAVKPQRALRSSRTYHVCHVQPESRPERTELLLLRCPKDQLWGAEGTSI